jgi:hypothetical protein
MKKASRVLPVRARPALNGSAAMVPMSSAPFFAALLEAQVGTRLVLASTIRLSPGVNLFFYVAIWVICVAAVQALAARAGVEISEEEAARYWRRSKGLGKSLKEEKRRRNLSRPDHREAYVAAYAPIGEIAPGLAEAMYDEWKTNPLTMVPYPDAPAVLK